MILCKPWKGNDLKGAWEVSYKLDGVRAFSDGVNVTSRSGKPLYNLDHLKHLFIDAEIFLGDFKSTIEAVRTKNKVVEILPNHIYPLNPPDPRLIFCSVIVDPTASEILDIFKFATEELHHEGIVLKQLTIEGHKTVISDVWLKVKTKETFDVPCLEFIEGTGKFKGTLGYAVTPMGRVGTGFSNEERDWFWANKPAGLIIEVECNRLTDTGMFRHAAFKHIRWDKS
jgi:ATP-dependent DNA ligase